MGRKYTKSHFSNKEIKANDLLYNPILQTYSNAEYESKLRKKEKDDLINNIVKNQDNQLKIEQTFNVINLADRLKGFEKDPNYPKIKDLINSRKKLYTNPKDYNIISNLPLTQHYFDCPEKRPINKHSEPKKRITYKIGQDSDFDIISTKYKHYNDEKDVVDKELLKIQTAQIFYKKNDYNPIKGEYFNKSKEEEFLKKREEDQKNWGKAYINNLPKYAKGKGDVYNLITLKVVDPKEMEKILLQEKSKKQRYDLRYKIEKYYHTKSLKNMDKQELNKNRKASFYRYKEQDKRQYDIIDLKERPFKEHENIIKTGGVSGWDKIFMGAGKNNTLYKKKIYKDLYDYSEASLSYHNYTKKRKTNLKNLPTIDNDKLFNKRIRKATKCNLENKTKVNETEEKLEKDAFDKEKIFKNKPKEVKYPNKRKANNWSFYAQKAD